MSLLTLEVKDLSVSYRRKNVGSSKNLFGLKQSFETVDALKGVTLEARAGETIGIVGHNGAGKSTLMRSLANQISYSGEIRTSGAVRLVEMNQAMSLTFTGRQMCDIVVSSLIKDRQYAQECLTDALEFSELGTALDASMRTYSKGMRTRLLFSALTVGNPKIVLIDEALTVGDRQFQSKAMQRLNGIADGAATVLICDHSEARLKKFCERGLYLRSGRLFADGPIENVLAQYKAGQPTDIEIVKNTKRRKTDSTR